MATTTRVLSEEQAHECAVRIDDAERHRLQIRQLSIEHPAMTIEDAYAVQGAWVSMKLARGGRLRGRKVGLTSRAMQMSSQIDEPDYGDLLEDICIAREVSPTLRPRSRPPRSSFIDTHAPCTA